MAWMALVLRCGAAYPFCCRHLRQKPSPKGQIMSALPKGMGIVADWQSKSQALK